MMSEDSTIIMNVSGPAAINSYDFVENDKLRFVSFIVKILPALIINGLYYKFVYHWGPKFMENRNPYNLKNIILIYNGFQIIVNLAMALCSIALFVKALPDWGCITSLPPNHSYRSMQDYTCYTYLILKYVDFADTVFFVLRKSTRQITFLHVYHHIFMSMVMYLYLLDQGTGGLNVIINFYNYPIHFLMYGYYFVSAIRPFQKQHTLWWKKYMTLLQIIQFIVGSTQMAWPLVFRSKCEISHLWVYIFVLQGIGFLGMFSQFYRKSYVKISEQKTN